ncbi:uncharacterized protein LOC122081255 isoform X2 [Macadamia integrifolia]|uniref:uncharacterized protein LOC122081255 isoform X2 n=1 Tax=Macadamia integrifolia TaxID=60698 RepID=UPI001C4F9228|nr:uncharacterized protein LOC122081255 isoform X2 [Macadamia integrifolia]
MESLSSVAPSIVLPRNNYFRRHSRRRIVVSSTSPQNCSRLPSLCSFLSLPLVPDPSRRRPRETTCRSGRSVGGAAEAGDGEEEDLERALHLDGTIPGTSDEFVKQVSSRAYDMRRQLQQTFDSSSYDVLEANPWREASKPVYVLTQKENQLCTMKTRRNRSEVERELGLLFSKGKKWRSEIGNKSKQSRTGNKFQMLVEDVREGVLVFEDENDAAKYCDLLEGGGQGCEGVAEIEASSKMRALAVLFRRGRTHPLPKSLELNLKARKRSLEDQEDLI